MPSRTVPAAPAVTSTRRTDAPPLPRLGLCCSFRDLPIRFRNTTVSAALRLEPRERRRKLAELCRANAEALLQALKWCREQGIGSFRVVSQILPLASHPECGYRLEELPGGAEIGQRFRACGAFAAEAGIRTGFHPDQFVVLNSQRPEVIEASIRELAYQAEMAELIGADTLNIHGGGVFGDKQRALDDFCRTVDRLPEPIRSRLTVENDDHHFTPADLLPICRRLAIPLVYDVHHHRCCTDELTIDQAIAAARETWNREPLFHLSSPLEGWSGPKPERHHDLIDPSDFPSAWFDAEITVEIEAKAKEVAVLKLRDDLRRTAPHPSP